MPQQRLRRGALSRHSSPWAAHVGGGHFRPVHVSPQRPCGNRGARARTRVGRPSTRGRSRTLHVAPGFWRPRHGARGMPGCSKAGLASMGWVGSLGKWGSVCVPTHRLGDGGVAPLGSAGVGVGLVIAAAHRLVGVGASRALLGSLRGCTTGRMCTGGRVATGARAVLGAMFEGDGVQHATQLRARVRANVVGATWCKADPFGARRPPLLCAACGVDRRGGKVHRVTPPTRPNMPRYAKTFTGL